MADNRSPSTVLHKATDGPHQRSIVKSRHGDCVLNLPGSLFLGCHFLDLAGLLPELGKRLPSEGLKVAGSRSRFLHRHRHAHVSLLVQRLPEGRDRDPCRHIRPVSLHTLRKTGASLLESLGVSRAETQVALRHKRPSVTDIYVSVYMEQRREHMEELADLLIDGPSIPHSTLKVG